jgi:hypothetical protein
MNLGETIDLLSVVAAFDRRTVGEADAMAWHAVLGDLNFKDSRAAVYAHYRESREWIMPADIRQRVAAIRKQRIDDAPPVGIPEDLADNPIAGRDWKQRTLQAIADGEDPQLAIGSGR